MSTTQTLLLILALLAVLVLVGWLVMRQRRSAQLQQRFGPEYDRTVEERGGRRPAEAELREREQRHAQLDIRPLPEERRREYARAWTAAQARFVDEPQEAVAEADALVTKVMSERGYPTEGFEQQAADLSVEHTRTLDHYREAHEISEASRENRATTEQLRRAMVHYRELFAELLEEPHGLRHG